MCDTRAMCAQDILDWRTSRAHLYWRLQRLLLEEDVKRKIRAANPDMRNGQLKSMIRRWFIEAKGTVNVGSSLALSSCAFRCCCCSDVIAGVVHVCMLCLCVGVRVGEEP